MGEPTPKNLRQARLILPEEPLSRAEFSRRCGVHRKTIENIELGKLEEQPSKVTVYKIARVLDFDYDRTLSLCMAHLEDDNDGG